MSSPQSCCRWDRFMLGGGPHAHRHTLTHPCIHSCIHTSTHSLSLNMWHLRSETQRKPFHPAGCNKQIHRHPFILYDYLSSSSSGPFIQYIIKTAGSIVPERTKPGLLHVLAHLLQITHTFHVFKARCSDLDFLSCKSEMTWKVCVSLPQNNNETLTKIKSRHGAHCSQWRWELSKLIYYSPLKWIETKCWLENKVWTEMYRQSGLSQKFKTYKKNMS